MQYLSNESILCLEYNELVPLIMSRDAYHKARERAAFKVHGRGGNGNCVLIEFESLPAKYKALVTALFGNPYEYIARQPLLRLVRADVAARNFYAHHSLPDGRCLPADYQQRYTRQAEWLNMILTVLGDKRALKQELRITIEQFWESVIILHQQDRPINPELPASYRRLREKVDTYRDAGYGALVDKAHFGNSNARKVDATIEQLILALYCDQTKPNLLDTCRKYNDFIAGKRHVVDLETGEAFAPEKYYVKGKPYLLSPASVKAYISKPLNRAVVDKFRMSALQYSTAHRPYMQGEKPHYAFSMITMDDTSSPFKMLNGKRPSTYKSFDVASEAIVGMEMQQEKPDVAMIRRLHAAMLRLIVSKGWAMPAEVQVEQHLNSEMRGKENAQGIAVADVLTAGAAYAFVEFVAPRNPQGKYAEHIISRYKYHVQARREGFQYRPFGGTERFRANDDSASHKMRFTYEQIAQMEQEDTETWNNAPHSDQERYPGLTRWQVLEQRQHPSLSKPNLPLVMPFIGHRVDTSIRRGYVQVQYSSYRLPDIKMLGLLDDEKLTAYYIADEAGDILNVYLYQNGQYICEAPQVERYQRATIERTAEDEVKQSRQHAYVQGFDTMVKERLAGLPKVGTVRAEVAATAMAEWVREDVEAEAWAEGENAGEEAQSRGVNAAVMVPKVQKKSVSEGGYLQKTGSSEEDYFGPKATAERARQRL